MLNFPRGRSNFSGKKPAARVDTTGSKFAAAPFPYLREIFSFRGGTVRLGGGQEGKKKKETLDRFTVVRKL